jgi:hypothetical protein
MKLAKILLLEMSLDDAKKLLGIDSSTSLDKAYKKAAMKHHPDRGGSDEMMKKVNQAYELLKASGGGKSYSQMSDDERRAAWQAQKEATKQTTEKNKIRMEKMLSEFSDRFMQAVPEYNEHFREFFNLKQPEIKTKLQNYSTNFWGQLFITWPTDDGGTQIRLVVEIRPEQGQGLGYTEGEPEYQVDYTTSLYHNRKDHKMGRRNWNWRKTSSETLNPENVFPKVKLKKVIKKVDTGKMTKKDFEKAIESELKKYNPSYKYRGIIVFDFDRPDRLVVTLDRSVFNRVPYWNVMIKRMEPNKMIVYDRSVAQTHGQSLWTSPESSEGLDAIKDFLNKFIKNEKIDKEHFNFNRFA